jgi:glycerol-3-phosphate dehydrogenase (NAD(P)+)
MAFDYKFAVLGAGAWGSALAKLLVENGHSTILWGRAEDGIDAIERERSNRQFLPGVRLPDELMFTKDTKEALSADIPLLVVPSVAFKKMITENADLIRQRGKLVWATKGLEPESRLPLDQVARQILGESIKLAVISGPNFAAEVARQVPTATTIASNDLRLAEEIAKALHNDWFRAYTGTDMTGAQLGGALKNALAIAAGIADGLGFGANTRAALLTRGLAEITRLAMAMGAKLETMMGLAGIGDLILTCTDNQSRNRRLGLLLAEGLDLKSAQDKIGQVVEGVKTAQVAYSLAAEFNIEMPINEQVYRILFEGVAPSDAVQELLSRELTREH